MSSTWMIVGIAAVLLCILLNETVRKFTALLILVFGAFLLGWFMRPTPSNPCLSAFR